MNTPSYVERTNWATRLQVSRNSLSSLASTAELLSGVYLSSQTIPRLGSQIHDSHSFLQQRIRRLVSPVGEARSVTSRTNLAFPR
jgi:hypothetical protein